MLRVLIFGKKGPLHEWHTTEASIYNLCRGKYSYINQPKFKKLFEASKSSIEKRLQQKFNVNIDGSKLQEYFCYNLFDTGHNAHKRRPKEMSRIIKIYTTCLEVLEEFSLATSSTL